MIGSRGTFLGVLIAVSTVSVILGVVLIVPALAAGDAPITGERTVLNDTIEPGDAIHVQLVFEIHTPGAELDIVDEVEPDVLLRGSGIESLDAPAAPMIADVGVNGLLIMWPVVDWDAGDEIVVEYALNTSPDMTAGETLTFQSASQYDGVLVNISGDDEVVIDEPRVPADYRLSELTPTPLESTHGGEPISVSIAVENAGGSAGTQDLVMEIVDDGNEQVIREREHDVALDVAERQIITFENIPVGDLPAGRYAVAIRSANDTVDAQLTVAEAAKFALSELDYPDDVRIAEVDHIDIGVMLENIGGDAGAQQLTLTIRNETGAVIFDATTAAKLDTNASKPVIFESIPITEFAAGEYTIQIASSDDEIRGTITVTEGVSDERLPGFTPFIAGISLVAAVLVARYRYAVLQSSS